MSTNQALTFRFAEASDAPVNLMKSLQEQHHLSLLVISRDLAVVPHLAETIGVHTSGNCGRIIVGTVLGTIRTGVPDGSRGRYQASFKPETGSQRRQVLGRFERFPAKFAQLRGLPSQGQPRPAIGRS
jgi:hypothetical protein